MQTAAGGAAVNASLSTSRELKVKATLLFCRMNLAGDSFLLEGTGGCGTQSLKGLQQLIVIGNRVFLAAPVNQRLPTIKQSAKQYVTPC